MEQTFQLETTINSDGTLLLSNLPFKAGDAIEVTIRVHNSAQRRPFGLCAGEFIVPDDFDDPLPEDILQDFEGK